MSTEQEQRNRFLRLAKDFDDNYTTFKGNLKDLKIKESKEKNITLKESLKNFKELHLYSQIDFNKIKKLTLNKSDNNPFYYFYSNSDIQLYNFFLVLHKTKLMLANNEKSFDFLRDAKSRKSLIKKYEAVIEDMGEHGCSEQTMITLTERIERLKRNPILTKRKVFENLLFHVWIYINFCNGIEEVKITDKVANITNEIIQKYFDEDINFTRKTILQRFTKHEYWHYNERIKKILEENTEVTITLWHS